jgi:transcriptional regulator with XRE-family HTH domain
MQDLWTGRRLRAIRHRLGWRQDDVAVRARTSQDSVSRVERGLLDAIPLRTIRAIARVLEADVIVTVRWRGGDLDRLLDEGHGMLGGRLAPWLEKAGWEVIPEVTFSVYGERGSIDLLAWHPGTRTLLVIEIKTELTSVEETLRRHDAKVRLAPGLAVERFGWQAATVARLLVLPDLSTARRRVVRHAAILARAYPMRGDGARQWIRSPSGPAAALIFASPTRSPRDRRHLLSRKRIRTGLGSRRDVSSPPTTQDART